MLLTHRPGPALAPYVEGLWYFDEYQSAHHHEHVLPNGRFQIVIDLSTGPGAVVGLHSRSIVIEPAAIQTLMGVLFRPGGARGFFDSPASDFYNQVIPFDLTWGPKVFRLRDRLRDVPIRQKFETLEAALLGALERCADRRRVLHPSIRHALNQFRQSPHVRTIGDIGKEAGLSRRRLSQLFREQVGMTPKLYCRLIRFRQVIRQIHTGGAVDWADMAVAGGYCDQAHLAHEFREFAGLSPGRYLSAERPHMNHVAVE